MLLTEAQGLKGQHCSAPEGPIASRVLQAAFVAAERC